MHEQLSFPQFDTVSHRLLKPVVTDCIQALMEMCKYMHHQYPPYVEKRKVGGFRRIGFIFSNTEVCEGMFRHILYNSRKIIKEDNEVFLYITLHNDMQIYFISVLGLVDKLAGSQWDLIMANCGLSPNEEVLINSCLRR